MHYVVEVWIRLNQGKRKLGSGNCFLFFVLHNYAMTLTFDLEPLPEGT